MARDGAVKAELNEQFARIGKALSAPRRLELLDLLAQGERSVEELATETQMSVGLASAHLQALRRARLVETRRDHSRIFYRLAGDDVYRLLGSLRSVARERLADVQVIARTYLGAGDGLKAVSRDDLIERLRARSVTVIDVRPLREYVAGHIPGALSMPVAEVKRRMQELPKKREVIAYCRGPYCVYSLNAVTLLRQKGYRARRAEEGLPEWRSAGLPVVAGTE